MNSAPLPDGGGLDGKRNGAAPADPSALPFRGSVGGRAAATRMPPGPRRRPRTLLEPPQRANAADEKIRPDARLQKAPTGGSPHHPPAAKAGATPRGVSRFPLPDRKSTRLNSSH